MRRIVSAVLLVCATLVIPTLANADDRQQERRYYHRDAKDYHTWNSQEDRAYRSYLNEQHRDYREFHRVKPTQREEYFRWRHNHPDSSLYR
jgi:hypothetical protein